MQTVETWKGEEIQVPVKEIKEPTVPMIGPPEEQIPATAANATVPLGALVQVSESLFFFFHFYLPVFGPGGGKKNKQL